LTGNIIGERFVLVSFGESHGRCIGAVVDGCPAGLELSEADIQRDLDMRRPGQSLVTTQRKEEDVVEILSGIFRGYTTGAPIAMLIRNVDKDSKAYEAIVNTPRPGHADYTAKIKYGNFNDYRGGGRFSGRITASYVMGGAIAKKLLKETLGIEILAYTLEIAGIRAENFTIEDARKNRYTNEVRCPSPEVAERIRKNIIEIRSQGDSLGGIVECIALNLPIGLGEPVFSSLDSDLARIALSIPAVKGVEFGSGFASTRMRGTENNDQYYLEDGELRSRTNNSGGILGGISSGMPLVYRVAFKPASSIAAKQKTVDISTNEERELIVAGRHDPTVVPRAVPVVESVTALVLADHAIRGGLIPPVLKREKKQA
jgi:chorismate synthase